MKDAIYRETDKLGGIEPTEEALEKARYALTPDEKKLLLMYCEKYPKYKKIILSLLVFHDLSLAEIIHDIESMIKGK